MKYSVILAALGVVGAMQDIKEATAPGGMLYVFGL